jgi:general secretion pathway protein N
MSGLFDTRNNLLTVLLVVLIAALAVAMLAQFLMMGRADVAGIAPSGSTEVTRTEVDVPETGLQQLDRYGSITSRPVFFSDRRLPVIELPSEEELAAADLELEDEEPIIELRAAVAGIIITPELKLAMVRDDAANKTLVLREGMSLDGEQAAWRLDSIDTRQVNFVSVDGRESLLELSVNTSALAAGSSGLTRQSNVQEPDPDQPQDRRQPTPPDVSQQTDARARAEEVRRRVAERRAELRAEAERRAQLQQQQRDNRDN